MNKNTLWLLGGIGAVAAFLFLRKSGAAPAGGGGSGVAASTGTAKYFPLAGANAQPVTNQLVRGLGDVYNSGAQTAAAISSAVSSGVKAVGDIGNLFSGWFKPSQPTAPAVSLQQQNDAADYAWYEANLWN